MSWGSNPLLFIGFSQPKLFTYHFSMQAFINYVLAFYGRDGVYDMGATRTMVCDIINTYLVGDVWIVPKHPYGTLDFGYDTLDRELIRDLLIEDYSLVFPD